MSTYEWCPLIASKKIPLFFFFDGKDIFKCLLMEWCPPTVFENVVARTTSKLLHRTGIHCWEIESAVSMWLAPHSIPGI